MTEEEREIEQLLSQPEEAPASPPRPSSARGKRKHVLVRRRTGRRVAAVIFGLCASAAVFMLLVFSPQRSISFFRHYLGSVTSERHSEADDPAPVLPRASWPGLQTLRDAEMPDWVDVQLIPVNGSARRGIELEDLTAIAIHYVGNPGTTAQQNRNYFALAETNVSSHFLIGLKGEIIQCVPLNEKSSATNDRNRDTISIEVCHPDESGEFTQESYDSLVRLCDWLCRLTGLTGDDLIRHYDVTGKICPKYFVDHEDAWDAFRQDVNASLEQ